MPSVLRSFQRTRRPSNLRRSGQEHQHVAAEPAPATSPPPARLVLPAARPNAACTRSPADAAFLPTQHRTIIQILAQSARHRASPTSRSLQIRTLRLLQPPQQRQRQIAHPDAAHEIHPASPRRRPATADRTATAASARPRSRIAAACADRRHLRIAPDTRPFRRRFSPSSLRHAPRGHARRQPSRLQHQITSPRLQQTLEARASSSPLPAAPRSPDA